MLLRDVVRAAADGPAGWARIDAALRERLRAACCVLLATFEQTICISVLIRVQHCRRCGCQREG